MSHSYIHNPVHIVFSTKQRRKLIPKELKPRLWAYMAGICKKQKIFVHEIGGMEDRVHMLIEIPLTLAHSDAIQEIKTSSSRRMDDGPSFCLAAWIRPLRRKRLESGRGNPLYPQPGGASQEDDLR